MLTTGLVNAYINFKWAILFRPANSGNGVTTFIWNNCYTYWCTWVVTGDPIIRFKRSVPRWALKLWIRFEQEGILFQVTKGFFILWEFTLVLTAGLVNAYINFKWAILVRPAYSGKGVTTFFWNNFYIDELKWLPPYQILKVSTKLSSYWGFLNTLRVHLGVDSRTCQCKYQLQVSHLV